MNNSPICQYCNCWMLEREDRHLKCVACGFTKKIVKRIVEVIPEKTHSESADKYRKKKHE